MCVCVCIERHANWACREVSWWRGTRQSNGEWKRNGFWRREECFFFFFSPGDARKFWLEVKARGTTRICQPASPRLVEPDVQSKEIHRLWNNKNPLLKMGRGRRMICMPSNALSRDRRIFFSLSRNVAQLHSFTKRYRTAWLTLSSRESNLSTYFRSNYTLKMYDTL